MRCMRTFAFLVHAVATCAALAIATVVPAQSPDRSATNRGLIRWPNNTEITVYIPADPDAGTLPGRRAALIKGMQLWFADSVLKNRHITMKVTNVEPAAGTANVVKLKWNDAGTTTDDQGHATDGEGGPVWDDNVKDASGNHTAVGGELEIDRSVTKDTDVQNLGAHEMGHVLGLAHGDNVTDVMYSGIRNFELPLSDREISGDVIELRATYAANSNDTQIRLTAKVTPIGNLFRYDYTATWLSGGPLAVFQIDTHGATLSDIIPATGWMIDTFRQPNDWIPSSPAVTPESFLGFVHQADDFNLSVFNPVLSFSFTANAPPGIVGAFFNGEQETIGPLVTPEPASFKLVAMGLAVAVLSASRIRKRVC